jgi:ABC-2 type transport system ATP-binding protein
MRLAVEGLTVRYGRRIAVDGFTLGAEAGEIVGLLGPNGAGKSTALLAVAGALVPSAGMVRIDGDDARLRRAMVGLCDQPPTMYEFFTVEEHLAFVAEARGAPAAGTAALIQKLGLDPVAKRLVRELSFGYRQRVGLAAALAGETRIVLLDETLNGLDPRASRLAREVLLAYAKEGATILMSTHLLGVAERLCTRLVFIDRGKLVRDLRGDELEAVITAGAGALEDLYLSLVGEERA